MSDLHRIAPIEVREDEVGPLARRIGGAVLSASQGTAPERIAVLCGNCIEMVAARDAITALGASMVPVNPKLAAPEIAFVLGHSRARVLLAHGSLATVAAEAAASLDPAARPRLIRLDQLDETVPLGPPSDLTLFGSTTIYTSGTTGHPKGCVRTEEQEAARAHELIASYSISASDVHLIPCPLAHSAPGIFLRACRSVGARTFIMERFRAESFLAAVEQVKATIFFMVPTQYERLLALPASVRDSFDISSIRVALVAGAPIAPATKEKLIDWLGLTRLWEFYGSSETGTVAVLPPDEQLTRPRSVGRPPAGVVIELRDESGAPAPAGQVGEIFVSSPTVMSGYLDAETGEVSTSASTISVGDLGRLDDDGYLYLVDRKHDMIISGGVNVYPAEVERALAEHPAVLGAVCFGVEDDDWGQIVAAAVAVEDPETADGHQVREFLRTVIAPFKIPKALAFISHEQLPVGSSGKPQRRKARAELAGSPRLRRYDH
jgi:long-chain acyl-CoA synthetase